MLPRLMKITVYCGIAWALTILMPSKQAWSQSAFVKWQVKNAQRNIQIERARVQPLQKTIRRLERISSGSGREAQRMAARVNVAYLARDAAALGSIDIRSMTPQDSMEKWGKKVVNTLSDVARKRAKTVLTGGAARLAAASSGIGTAGEVGLEVLDIAAKVVEYRNTAARAREMKRILTTYQAGQIGAGSLAAERRAELAQVQQRIANLQRLVKSGRGGKIGSAKGVRIHFDDRILARALARFGDKTTNENFKRIEESLFTAPSPDQIGAAFRAAANHEKGRFIRETKKTTTVRKVVLVSLNAVARKGGGSAGKRVRDLGGITRVYGFIRVPKTGDVVLVGGIERGVPAVGLDNLVTALKSVWKEGNVPTVSLDADPTSALAPQIVRVNGIPKNSRFAKIMLDADYDAKRILMGDPTLRLNVPGFKNVIQIMASLPPAQRKGSHGRIWLTPEQPEEGEIQISNVGDIVLYETGVRILTEEMQWVGRLNLGTGRIAKASEAAVDSFTKHYREFERRRPVFRQLHALFDLVMLAKVLRQLGIKTDALERLAALPQPRYPVPNTYKAFLGEHIVGGRVWRFAGGVVTHSFLGNRHRLHYDTAVMAQLRAKAAALSRSGRVAARAEGVKLVLVVPSGRRRFYVQGVRSMARRAYDQAERWFSRLIKDDPHFGEAYVERAQARFNLGKRKAARADLKRAIAMLPGDRMLRVIHFLSLIEEGQKPEQIKMPWAVRADLATFMLREARSLFVVGKGGEALKSANLAVILNKKDHDALTFRAWLLLQAGRPTAALKDAERAVKVAPKFASAYTVRAIAALALGRKNEDYYEDAFEDLSTAIKLEPNVPEWWFNRARVLHVWGNRSERDSDVARGHAAAITHYSKLIEKRPDLAVLYLRRGTTRVRAGKIRDGIKDFDAAIRQDPRLAIAYVERAGARHTLQQYDGALADANSAVRLDSKLASGFAARCAAQYKLRRSDEALRSCDRAIRLNPKLGYAFHIRAVVKRDRGNRAGARRDWRRAQKVDPARKGFYQQLIDLAR